MLKLGTGAVSILDLPYSYGILFTKLVYFGRIFGAISVFCSGLFATGLEYQRTGLTFTTALVLSIALVTVLPVDPSAITSSFTFRIGSFREVFIAICLFHALSVANFLIAAAKNGGRDFLFLAAGLAAAIAGREMVFFTTNLIAASAGYLLLLGGTVAFSQRTHRIYLWY